MQRKQRARAWLERRGRLSVMVAGRSQARRSARRSTVAWHNRPCNKQNKWAAPGMEAPSAIIAAIFSPANAEHPGQKRASLPAAVSSAATPSYAKKKKSAKISVSSLVALSKREQRSASRLFSR